MDKTKTVMDDDWFSEPLVAFCGITNAFGPSSHFRACRPKKIENNLTRLNKSSCKKQKLSMELEIKVRSILKT